MTTIQIFDPALCCSTGVCGVEVDQNLVNFAADVDWAKQNGAQVERFNLAQQPLAFAENPTVKVPLYHDHAVAFVRVRVGPAVAPGDQSVTIAVSYQSCNDQMCTQPNTQEAGVKVHILAAGSGARCFLCSRAVTSRASLCRAR